MDRSYTEERCEVDGCNDADFLPTRCIKCRKLCCSAHLSYDSHRCPLNIDSIRHRCPICNVVVKVPNGQAADGIVSAHIDSGCTSHIDATALANDQRGGINVHVAEQQALRIASGNGGLATLNGHAGRLNFCSKNGCTTNESILITCPYCAQSYCITHRSPLDHQCAKRTTSPTPALTPSSPIPDPTKPLAKKVQPSLLHKRRFANTMATAHQKEKITDGVTVAVFIGSGASDGVAVAPFYITFQRRNPIGLALDRLCRAGNVTNSNNTARSDGEKWFIFCLTSSKGVLMEMALDPNMLVEEVASDGDVWFVGRGPTLPDAVAAEVASQRIKVTEGRRMSSAGTVTGGGGAPHSAGSGKDGCLIS